MPTPTPHLPARRLPIVLAIAAMVVAGVLLPHPSGAETDAERERDRVRQERADSAANVNALEADHAEVQAALAELNDQVTSEEEALASAERAVADAEADQQAAEQGITEAEASLADLEERLRSQMVEAYTTSDGESASILDAANATDLVKRRAILSGRAADDEDLVDQVRAARADLRAQRRAAVAAGERAEAERQEVQRRLDSVEAARDQQSTFAAQVQERIDAEVARGIELAQEDEALSAQILREAAEQQARLARIAEQQRQQEEAARQADAAAQQQQQEEAAAATPTYDDDGGESAGPVAPAGGGGVAPAGGGSGGVSLCSASGITVNCQIASQVSAMVNAAAGAGVSLSGGGYRDPQQQINLRRAHCGSSYYAIYEMPSSQCSPPTARPGSSNHELGLAIDFNNCSSRGTACYRWLAANASRFGMFNLPSEPWHWSVNGN